MSGALPPVPPELKPISAYVQRAEELRPREPIVAYWCAYHAAQQGISLKAKSGSARSFLSALLSYLESLQTALSSGPEKDVIDSETASAAYLENFALRVFKNADDEDRRGLATRSTARKFLAGSTFLTLLTSVFSSASVVPDREGHLAKVKYAKWRAAEINKAVREGRRPAPPPKDEEEQEGEVDALLQPPPAISGEGIADEDRFFPNSDITRATSASPQRAHYAASTLSAEGGDGAVSEARPGSRSSPPLPATPPRAQLAVHGSGIGLGGSESVPMLPPLRPVSPFVGPHGLPPDHSSQADPSNTDSASVTAGSGDGMLTPLSASGGSPGGRSLLLSPQSATFRPPEPPIIRTPPPKTPSLSSAQTPSTPLVPASAPPPPSPPTLYAHSAPQFSYTQPPTNGHPPYASPPPNPPYTPPSAKSFSSSGPYTPLAPHSYHAPPPPPSAAEITPEVIAKAQKHARYAISALDYEDVEQARKELRDALRAIDGL